MREIEHKDYMFNLEEELGLTMIASDEWLLLFIAVLDKSKIPSILDEFLSKQEISLK
jgi:hypothetical protein